MSLSMSYMRTSLVILNINRGLVYIGECPVSLRMGYMRTTLVSPNIDRVLAHLGVSGEFEYGKYADQSAYPKKIEVRNTLGSVW